MVFEYQRAISQYQSVTLLFYNKIWNALKDEGMERNGMDSYDLYRFLWSDKSEIKKKAEMIYDSILFDRDRVLQDAVDIRYDLCGPPMLGLYLNSLK